MNTSSSPAFKLGSSIIYFMFSCTSFSPQVIFLIGRRTRFSQYALFFLYTIKQFLSEHSFVYVVLCGRRNTFFISLVEEPGSPKVRLYFYTPLSGFYPSTVMFTLFYVAVATRFSSHWRKNQVRPKSYLIGSVLNQSSPHIRDGYLYLFSHSFSNSMSDIQALWKG